MEKPRKINKKEDFSRYGYVATEYYNGWNDCHDAMSTWLEGEVPSAKEMARVFVDYENEHKDCTTTEAMTAVHALITRKLTGKE